MFILKKTIAKANEAVGINQDTTRKERSKFWSAEYTLFVYRQYAQSHTNKLLLESGELFEYTDKKGHKQTMTAGELAIKRIDFLYLTYKCVSERYYEKAVKEEKVTEKLQKLKAEVDRLKAQFDEIDNTLQNRPEDQ